MFCRKGNLLALKWKDKRDVYISTGIHKADSVASLKRTYKGEKIRKPEAVFIYNWYMSSVDLTDQLLSSYSFLRRSVKWSKKFFVHCINMVTLNAYVLYKHYAKEKKTHKQFHLDIVKHLLENAKETPRVALEIPEPVNSPLRLIERHFIEKIPLHAGCKRTCPSHKCYVCNSVKQDALTDLGLEMTDHRKFSSYWCPQCRRTLCIDECFRLFHTFHRFCK